MENDQKEILNVEEAALLLRISRDTVYVLAEQGKIPSRKVGKHWRFHRATLLKWVSGDMPLNEIGVQGDKKR
jgi:excisionase family DNA binding protein